MAREAAAIRNLGFAEDLLSLMPAFAYSRGSMVMGMIFPRIAISRAEEEMLCSAPSGSNKGPLGPSPRDM